MLVSDVIRRVRANVGDKQGIIYEDADYIDLCNDAQLEINREVHVITDVDSIVTSAAVAEYALNADFILAKNCRYTLGDYEEFLGQVAKESLNKFIPGRLATTATGLPSMFYISGTKVGFYPTPDDVYTYELEYVKAPTTLTTISDSLSLPTYLHPLVARFCMAAFKETDEDFEAARLLKGEVIAKATEMVYTANNSSGESYPVVRDIDFEHYPVGLNYD